MRSTTLLSWLGLALLLGCPAQPGSPEPLNLIELLRRPMPTVATQRNDNGRTGVNNREYVLNPDALRSGEFQLLDNLPVDGQVYAQPLFLPRVRYDGAVRDLLIVATMKNKLYAFDVSSRLRGLGRVAIDSIDFGSPVAFDFIPMAYSQGGLCPWKTPSSPGSANSATGHPYNIFPSIGITSTPVIDTTTMTLYLTTKRFVSAGRARYALHALTLLPKLSERSGSPVAITASVPGDGAGSSGGSLSFDPSIHLQRAALLLESGRLYLAFGSHQDTGPFHGWMFEYEPATLRQTAVFATNPRSSGAAIWQAGNGLVGDGAGAVFAITGNQETRVCIGDPGLALLPPNHEHSFMKFGAGLSLSGSMRHPRPADLNDNDLDLGSSGPVLLPGTTLLAGAGKDATLFLVNAGDMSLVGSMVLSNDFDQCVFPKFFGCGWPHVHGSPVAWRDSPSTVRLFVWPEHSRLLALSVTPSGTTTAPPAPVDSSAFIAPRHSMPGGLVSLSWNGTRNATAVLWASLPISEDALTKLSPGVLRAFQATSLGTELWNSERNAGRDGVGLFAKNAAPVVADGRVYLATFSNLVQVYGMRQWVSRVAASEDSRNGTAGLPYGPLLTIQNTGNRPWTTVDGDSLRVTFTDPTTGTVASTSDLPMPRDSIQFGELIQMSIAVPSPAAGSYSFEARMVTGATNTPFGERLLQWNINLN